jgi:hypothetical protein
MQAPNAQGIGGLMSRPQQTPQQPQQPMPNPQSGSPMAGLGSVQERVNAYRGNPAPLQQRYAVSQDLLDLLALQKIKSEKEAAARQMQLSMGQQAAAQGGEPPTIAQQREKEVMDMTKNELAQQRGATANQQVSQQQQAMQRMMGGIAGAPGANAVAQPKMMAAGGIVGYADGGDVGGKKPLDERAQAELQEAQRTGDRNAMLMTIKKLAAAGYDVATLIPRGLMGAAEDVANTRLGRALGVDFMFPQAAYGGDRESMTPMMDRIRRAEAGSVGPAAAPTTPSAPASSAGAGRGMVNPTMADPNTPLPPPQALLTSRPAPTGLARLPGAQGAPSTIPGPSAVPTTPGGVPAAPGFEDAIKQGILGGTNRDPMAEGQKYGQSVQERLMFPEEQERRRAAIAEQRKLYDQEFDPERQRQEKLSRFLLGMSGRRYGEFAGGAGAAMDYATAQRAAQRERLKGLEDMEQGLFSLRKGASERGIASEMERMQGLQQEKTSATTAGVQQLGTEERARAAREQNISQEKIAAMNRQVQMAQVQAQRDRNAVDKEFMNQQKLENLKLNHLKSIQDVRKLVGNQYATEREGVAQRLFSAKDPKEVKKLQQRLQEIDTLVEAQVSRDAKDFIDVVRKIDSKLSGTGGLPPGVKIEEITE